jgi:hypothetical protein
MHRNRAVSARYRATTNLTSPIISWIPPAIAWWFIVAGVIVSAGVRIFATGACSTHRPRSFVAAGCHISAIARIGIISRAISATGAI